MTAQLTIAIALACTGVAQAVLAQVLSGLFDPLRRRLIEDLTQSEKQAEFDKFFHHHQYGAFRLEKIAIVSGIADTVAAQCIALLVSVVGSGILAWVAVTSHQNVGWLLGCLVLGLGALALFVSLVYRARKNKLTTFGMGLRGNGNVVTRQFSLDSARPYIAVQLLAVAFAAAAGVVF